MTLTDDVRRSTERVSRRTQRLCAALIALVVVAAVPTFFVDGTGLTTNPIYVQDLAVWLPAMAIVAVLLWQRRPSGVFLAGAGLVFWVIEAIGVAVDQWFGHRADPTSDVATLAGVVLFVVLGAATLVPLILWVRAIPPRTPEGRRS